MNPLNYASLEASQRLTNAGIVLETDFYWVDAGDGYNLFYDHFSHNILHIKDKIPAPSMAEVWREFNKYSAQEFAKLVRKKFDPRNEKGLIFYLYYVVRNVDNLTDLLIM